MAGGKTYRKLTLQMTGKEGSWIKRWCDGQEVNRWVKTNGLTSECRMCQPTPNATSPTSHLSGETAKVPGAPGAEAAGDYLLQDL